MSLFNPKKLNTGSLLKSQATAYKNSILIVDDEKDNIIVLEQSLKELYQDVKIFTALNGSEALKIMHAASPPIDLVITDQRMPQMTGVQLLSQVKAVYPHTVRVILTGFTDIDTIIEAINSCQIYQYITKPWDLSKIRVTIESALEKVNIEKKYQLLMQDLKVKNQQLEVFQQQSAQNKLLKMPIHNGDKLSSESREVLTFLMPQLLKEDLYTQFAWPLQQQTKRVSMLLLACHIKDLSRAAEGLEAEEYTDLVQSYTQDLGEIIHHHQGFILHVLDGMCLAGWLNPRQNEGVIQQALQAALDIQKHGQKMSLQWPEIATSLNPVPAVVMHAGFVSLGYFGGEHYRHFSIAGTCVSQTLECLNQTRPGQLLALAKLARQFKQPDLVLNPVQEDMAWPVFQVEVKP